ncbi:class I adenylate-forming enzyme family protein [Caballeronia mineralivorans]|uniref:class I adenylate-forming enzyme family protein n=1 Tax=Caballeronia mineralivorans TaxID=2010198 RepID=UPI0023F122E6|nr:class I adenylate-forming enzyme family protein [Caballeronia mineralivorans]MDB5786333.1 AMP-binding enzyme family protein [Caballeronia mineralivorans]MEA3100666.1 steroid-24-oyl-CoA synthetase [Caballeronia mineralivorans]
MTEVLAETGQPKRWGRTVESVIVNQHACRAYSDRPRSLDELLTDSLRWKDRPFLVEGKRRFTFEEHARAVSRVAVTLREAGVGPGERVMLLGFNRVEWLLAFWAIQRLGAVAALGNAWWSDTETAHAIEQVEPSLILTDRAAERVFPHGYPRLGFDGLLSGVSENTAADAKHVDVDEDAPAILMFSSGTTGAAKAVVMSHRAVIANIQNVLVLTGRLPDELGPGHKATTSLLTVPLFHLSGIQISFSTLLSGGSLVFLEGRFSPEKVLHLIQQERIRVWGGVPTMVSRVVEYEHLMNFDTSSLKSIPMGGAAVSPELREKITRAFPQIKRRVGSLYGLTEAGGVLAAASGTELHGRAGCVGRPLPVVEIRIDNPDPQGAGEIFARTPSAATCYWGESEPITDADGWIRTGDLGRLDNEGLLYVVGRSKEIIIRAGENVAAVHVERCIANHPDVLEVAVVALPHADLGEEVAAVVVLRSGAATSVGELEAHARTSLSRFEIPSRWWIRTSTLPTNPTGKILKRELIAQWPTEQADVA